VGTLALAFGATAVAGAGILFAACLRLRSAVGFLLAAYLLASAEIVAVSLLLSIGGWLTRDALLVVVVAVVALAALVWARLGRPRPPLSSGTITALREAFRDPAVVALAVLAGIAHLYLVAGALTVPQSSPDTLLYHLPRAALWKQQHAVAYVANSPDERVNATPPNAEIETMSSMLLSGGDRYVTLVQLLALLVTCVAILGTAHRLGLGTREAAFGALAFSTFTVIALQTPTALNDLVVASLLVAAAYFVAGTSRLELGLTALALGLALGTKVTAAFALPVLAFFALSIQPRGRWPWLALSGAVGLAAGSYWYLVNLVHTGRVDGGLITAFPQSPDRAIGSTLERIGFLLMDLLELSGAEGEGRFLRSRSWGLAVLGLAVAAAVMLAMRKRWLAAVATGLAGAFAAVAFPMLSVWTEVVGRAFRQVGVAVGLATASSGSRVPEELYEGPMHSAYGLAFVLLLFGAGALVAVDVVRSRLPFAALSAIAGVPLFVLVFALAVAYDPMRMRFLAFPVALAAAVFGVALRVPLLAWAAVALTAVTLTVSLAYFAPRPAGFALLPGNKGTDRAARWLVQGESGGSTADLEAFRFLELEVPAGATLALAVERNTYLYPAWDSRLHRTVLFASQNGTVPQDAELLVVGPNRSLDVGLSSESGWRPALATTGGWRVFSKSTDGN